MLTFGNTNIEFGLDRHIGDQLYGGLFSLSESGNISSITAHIVQGPGSNLNFKYAIYRLSGTLLGYTEEGNSYPLTEGESEWRTLNLTSILYLEAGNYILVCWSEFYIPEGGGLYISASSSGGISESYSISYSSSFPSNISFSSSTELLSIYANYTPYIAPPPFLIGFQVSGKIGKEGDSDPLNVNGIYQNRKTKKGKVPIKMKFYRPANPETEAQQANRQKFADAMTAWGNLTSEQKQVYNVRAKKRQMFGWGLFIREYYQAN